MIATHDRWGLVDLRARLTELDKDWDNLVGKDWEDSNYAVTK